MAYDVEITPAALQDAEDYYAYILQRSFDAAPAVAWWQGLETAVNSLASFPNRCPTIPEQKHFSEPLRHLLYASHRIVFRVRGKVVEVLRIRHGALEPMTDLRKAHRVRTSRKS